MLQYLLEELNLQALIPLLKVLTACVREAFLMANLKTRTLYRKIIIKICAGLPLLASNFQSSHNPIIYNTLYFLYNRVRLRVKFIQTNTVLLPVAPKI